MHFDITVFDDNDDVIIGFPLRWSPKKRYSIRSARVTPHSWFPSELNRVGGT